MIKLPKNVFEKSNLAFLIEAITGHKEFICFPSNFIDSIIWNKSKIAKMAWEIITYIICRGLYYSYKYVNYMDIWSLWINNINIDNLRMNKEVCNNMPKKLEENNPKRDLEWLEDSKTFSKEISELVE